MPGQNERGKYQHSCRPGLILAEIYWDLGWIMSWAEEVEELTIFHGKITALRFTREPQWLKAKYEMTRGWIKWDLHAYLSNGYLQCTIHELDSDQDLWPHDAQIRKNGIINKK